MPLYVHVGEAATSPASLWPLILPNWLGDAFSIFLLRQFFLTIPDEYTDAARVDGCGEFRDPARGRPADGQARRSRRSRCSPFFYAWNDYYGPLLYTGENQAALDAVARPRRSSATLHQVQWNLTMAATCSSWRPVVAHVLLRAEGLRRGHHADGGQGMKVAVVGGGSTYTPELVDGFARERDAPRRGRAGAPRHRRRRGSRWSAGWRARMLARAGLRRARSTRRPTSIAARRRRRRRAHPAARRRPGGAAAATRRSRYECGCIGQETTGAGGLRQGAAHGARSCSTIAERVRELAAPDAWIVDFTNPVGIVTRALLDAGHRAVGLCNVAIGFQRRFAALLGVDARAGRLDQVGLNHLTWVRAVRLDGDDVLAELLARPRRRARRARSGCRAALLDELGAVPSYYLRYFYAHDEVLAEQRVRDAARGRRSPRSSASCSSCTRDPALDDEAGAARAARRRVLQRGGDGAARLARWRRATATCRWWTCATTATLAGLARRRRRRGARARRAATARRRCRSAPLAPELLGLVAARRRVRAARRCEAAVHARPGASRAARCSRTR